LDFSTPDVIQRGLFGAAGCVSLPGLVSFTSKQKRASTMSIRWVLLAGALNAVLLTGCSGGGDLGHPCTLIRKNPNEAADGIKFLTIKESEIVPGRDYISFGVTECEEFVCVRDANAPKGKPGDDAQGVCTRSCVTDSTSCSTGVDKDYGGDPFTCRALLLDQETLAAIKDTDPVKYAQTFGDNLSPYYCAPPLKQP
jgi:hypothetical protein